MRVCQRYINETIKKIGKTNVVINVFYINKSGLYIYYQLIQFVLVLYIFANWILFVPQLAIFDLSPY